MGDGLRRADGRVASGAYREADDGVMHEPEHEDGAEVADAVALLAAIDADADE